MKYLLMYWLFGMMLPLCNITINLEPWMSKKAVQKKPAQQETSQELTMNPIFIFK